MDISTFPIWIAFICKRSISDIVLQLHLSPPSTAVHNYVDLVKFKFSNPWINSINPVKSIKIQSALIYQFALIIWSVNAKEKPNAKIIPIEEIKSNWKTEWRVKSSTEKCTWLKHLFSKIEVCIHFECGTYDCLVLVLFNLNHLYIYI